MTTQDRQLLDALNQRHYNLEVALAGLKADLQTFTARLVTPAYVPPPRLPEPEPFHDSLAAAKLPPLPAAPAPEAAGYAIPSNIPAAPPVAAPATPEQPEGPGFEIRFGRWLARIGVVFALLTLIFLSVLAYDKFHQYIGAWSKLGLFTLVSAGLIAGGLRLERTSNLLVYGRTLAGGGLACLYYTLYGATYVSQLRVIYDPILGGIVLLAWSAGVLWLAERRKSELLSIFAISLAYFSSAITPVGNFTMAANLLLAATAIVFLVRNAWTGLSYLCLIGTYLGFVRQTVVVTPFDVQFISHVEFWPLAIYLTGAWVIFTAGIFLAKAPGFDGDKRLAFLWLNNGAWTGLLLVAAKISGFGHIGDLLLVEGFTLLGASGIARALRADAAELAGAYLLQSLALGTAGAIVAWHGVTRGLILTTESVLLAAAGAYSRQPLLRMGGSLAALLGTAFLFNETLVISPFPWWLTCGGAMAMLANAWLARFDPRTRAFRPGFSFACASQIGLALLLIVRWIYGVVPDEKITLVLFALATLLVIVGLLGKSSTLIRAGFMLDVVGAGNYLVDSVMSGSGYPTHVMTWMNLGGVALFLAQPALVRQLGRELISVVESGLVVVASSALGWLFVSDDVAAIGSPHLTLAWALFALALIILGFAANERRQRWCGLAILAAAFVRVGMHDFWGFSDTGKVLTFFALTVICLGLSFLYYKFAERFREWL